MEAENKLDSLYANGVLYGLEFIETPTFTRLISELVDDDNYSRLQTELVRNPEKGVLISTIIIGNSSCEYVNWNYSK